MTQYRTREFVNPGRDWFVGLVLAMIMLAGGGAYIMYDFHTQVIEHEGNVTITEAPLQYDERAVLEQSNRFKEREITFTRLRNERMGTVYIEKPTVTEEPQSSNDVTEERIEMQ